jgi:hypothetical protein
VWLPPQFLQAEGSLASAMLAARLSTFDEQNPEIKIETRLKALEGPGGFLDSLVTASVAAPLALPDLVALPRPLLETAALKGLVYPLDGQVEAGGSDWFEYAQGLSMLQSSAFGLPFAGDALLLAYHAEDVTVLPENWEALFVQDGNLLAFPASDPEALFTLLLYQAVGGKILDEQGRPFLEVEPLIQVLDFFQRAAQAGLMPYWLTQYEDTSQAWQDFESQQVSMIAAWASTYYLNRDPSIQALPVPVPVGTPSFTLATGWVWALANPQPERRQMSLRLAEYLLQDEFLARWTQAAGLLPPRQEVLDAWTDAPARQLAGQLASSAVLYPSADVLSSLGPVLRQATMDVLRQQTDPLTAAQAAVNRLQSP